MERSLLRQHVALWIRGFQFGNACRGDLRSRQIHPPELLHGGKRCVTASSAYALRAPQIQLLQFRQTSKLPEAVR